MRPLGIAREVHPVMRWNFTNIEVRTAPAGNRTFHKGKSRDKIDGAVAAARGSDRLSCRHSTVQVDACMPLGGSCQTGSASSAERRCTPSRAASICSVHAHALDVTAWNELVCHSLSHELVNLENLLAALACVIDPISNISTDRLLNGEVNARDGLIALEDAPRAQLGKVYDAHGTAWKAA